MLKSRIYSAIRPLVRRMGPHLFNTPLMARLLWDSAPSQSLLLASCPSESFVVATGDLVIGQALYKQRVPFDFSKLQRVLSLLGEQRLTLLLDIGANIGTICIPAITRGLFEKAIAIEPEPLNFSLLRTNVELNRIATRITTHNLALGEADDQTLLFDLSASNFGDHRVRLSQDKADTGGETIQVPSQTLDRIVEGTDLSSALLWMDTQGFEGHVLAGATRTLKSRPPLVIEFWPGALARTGGMDRLKAALAQAGYATFFDLEQPDAVARPFTTRAIDELAAELGWEERQTDLLLL